MSKIVQAPSVPRTQSVSKQRLTAIERKLDAPGTRFGPPEVDFSYGGRPLIGKSPRWYCRVGRAVVYEIVASLETVGTTPTIAVFTLGVSDTRTVTVPANTNVIIVGTNTTLGNGDDYLMCELTQVGTGARGFTGQVRLKYP